MLARQSKPVSLTRRVTPIIPTAWRLLSDAEASVIFGKGAPNNIDDSDDEIFCRSDEDSSIDPKCILAGGGNALFPGNPFAFPDCVTCCPGMPQWRVSEPYITLWIEDTPMQYITSYGQPISFRLSYKERNTRASRFFMSVGENWECSWLGFVRAHPGAADDARLYAPGGGERIYTANIRDYQTGSVLTYYGGSSGSDTNQIVYQNGATNIFGFTFPYDLGYVDHLLTEKIDPQGRNTKFYYETTNGYVRLSKVVDPDSRTNTFGYDTTDVYLLTKITNHYGKVVTLQYSSGKLTSITDVANLASTFEYNGATITTMKTPYSTNTFEIYEAGYGIDLGGTNEVNRAIRIAEQPTGATQMYFYRDEAIKVHHSSSQDLEPFELIGSDSPNVLGLDETFDRSYLNRRDSYFWGRKQYALLSAAFRTNAFSYNSFTNFTLQDYKYARMRHWLHETNANLVSSTISHQRDPSPNGSDWGQRTWFDYQGKNTQHPEWTGPSSWPSFIAQILPNGKTKFVFYGRNSQGYPTIRKSSYSVGEETPLIRTNTFVYQNNIDLEQVKDTSNNLVVSNAFNSFHQVTTHFNAATGPTLFYYNNRQQLSGIKLPSGASITNTFYSSGTHTNWLLETRVVETGARRLFAYTDGMVATLTNELDLVTSFAWDALLRPTSVAYPDATLSFAYDRLDLASVVTPVTTNYFTYNHLQQRLSEVQVLAEGNRTNFYSYCNCGELESLTQPLGVVTQFYYDTAGRMTNVVYPASYSVTNYFDLAGRLTKVTDGLKTRTNYFNNQGLLTLSSNSLGRIFGIGFDAEDRATTITNANGVVVTQTFDAAGRLLTRSYPDGGQEGWIFGSTNFAGPTSYTNQIGNTVSFAYDLLARLTNQVFAGIATNRFGYDLMGNLNKLTNGNNQVVSWSFDRYGRLTNKTDQAGSTVFTNSYDSIGRLATRWTPAKGSTSYTYDGADNLTAVNYPSSADLALQYDPLNRLTNAVVAGTFTNRYSYNGLGQLLTEDGPWADDTVTYTYNSAALRTVLSLAQPSASAWTNGYSYDAAKRLTNQISAAGSFGYSYDSTRKLEIARLSLPGSLSVTNSFDSVARLLNTKLYWTSPSFTLNSHSYTNNSAGQRTAETRDAALNWINFTYDSVGQLKTALATDNAGSVARGHEQFKYLYDPAGNLTIRTNNALIQTFTVNAINQVTNVSRSGTFTVAGGVSDWQSVTINGSNVDRVHDDLTFSKAGLTLTNGANSFTAIIGPDSFSRKYTNTVSVTAPNSITYSYDDNGNLTSDGTRSFGYDDENQLTSVQVTGSWKVEYQYDEQQRRRVRKEYTWNGSSWVLASETRYVYDGRLVIQERNGSNARLVSYTRGLDLSGSLDGAGGIGGLIARTEHTSYGLPHSYYHHDGNGNVIAMANSQGQVVARYLYEPFGTLIGMSGWLAETNTMRFSGKEYDERAGIYYYGFRFYEPSLQRWLNQDPIGERGGLNLYGFVYNGPINLIDPYGEAAKDIADWIQRNVECWKWRLTKDSTSALVTGSIWTAGDLITSLTDPLRLGESAGDISVTGGDASDYFWVTLDEASRAASIAGGAGGAFGKLGSTGKGLTTPGKYFGNKTAQELSETLNNKFGPPRSVRPGAETYYNPRTGRSFNVHTDPAHGPPHVDIRRRGGYPERQYPLK